MPPIDLKRGQVALSTSQVTVLRRIVKDANFRKEFLSNPMEAVGNSGVKMSASELASIEKLNASQFEAIQGVVNSLSPGGKVSADGTHTLAYAVAFAVVVALLIAMPNPMDVAAGIQIRE